VPVVVHCLISHGDASPTVMTMWLAYNRLDVFPLLFSQIAYSYCINEICQQQIVLSVMATAMSSLWCLLHFLLQYYAWLYFNWKVLKEQQNELESKGKVVWSGNSINYSVQCKAMDFNTNTVHCTLYNPPIGCKSFNKRFAYFITYSLMKTRDGKNISVSLG